MRPHLDQRIRYLGTISLHQDFVMEPYDPMDGDEKRAAMDDMDDDALRDRGIDPDLLTPTERLIALDLIAPTFPKGAIA